jgi:hypothetical protein
MGKSVKNSPHLTGKQRQIVAQIIISVAGQVHYLTEIMSDREEYAKKFLKSLRTKQNLALSFTFLKIISDPKALFPSNLNQQLAMAIAKDSKPFLKGPTLRKILKILEDDGIVRHISGKKNVMHDVGRNIIKQQRSEDKRGGGQYSAYKRETNVQDLLDVLSNPVALQIIHRAFKSSSYLDVLLRKYFKLLFENLTYILCKGDEETILKAFDTTRPIRTDDSNLNISDLHRLVPYMKNFDRKILDRLGDKFANKLMEEDKTLNTLYLLFSFAMM